MRGRSVSPKNTAASGLLRVKEVEVGVVRRAKIWHKVRTEVVNNVGQMSGVHNLSGETD